MNLPFFYIDQYNEGQQNIVLNEDSSRHIIQVLRMKTGEQLNLTDGKGHLLTAVIIEEHKKHCTVKVETSVYKEPSPRKVSIAISLVKNTSRFEWFLEKAVEIGVDEITPLLCQHSERDAVRLDRLEIILVSAMKQSLRAYLPRLNELTRFQKFVASAAESEKRIAWCTPDPLPHLKATLAADQSAVIAIGPEGDFSPEEVSFALQNGFTGVSLGTARLRTETAGVLAVTIFNLL